MKHYLVFEIQTNNGEVSTLLTAFSTLKEAYAKFHSILSYAYAANLVDMTTVMVVDNQGVVFANEYVIKDETPVIE